MLRATAQGASSNIAAAMKVGDVLFVIQSDLTLSVSGGGNSRTLTPSQAGSGGLSFSGMVAKRVTTTAKGKSVTGWEIAIAGGGQLIAYRWPKPSGMPTGALLSLWVHLPSSAVSSASGMCAQACSGLPPLPNVQCGNDVCLPVLASSSLFSTALLSSLETAAEMPASTRTCGGAIQPPPPPPVPVSLASPPPPPPPADEWQPTGCGTGVDVMILLDRCARPP